MNSDRHLQIGYAYLYIRDFARAAQAFEEAIVQDPTNPECYFHASMTAHRNNLLDLAEQRAIQALQLDATNPLYRQHLEEVIASKLVLEAEQEVEHGNILGAKQKLLEAIERDPLNHQAEMQLHHLNMQIAFTQWIETKEDNS